MKRILIISDGKKGHLNQSIAFCKIKKISYDILEVKFKSQFAKISSYVYDKLSIYNDSFFEDYKKINHEFYDAIVSCGSGTYYFNKLISKKFNIKSIVLMLPKGYKYEDFDFIIAQKHDNPPKLDNIVEVPLNISFSEPKNIVKKEANKKALGIIIGGNNDVFSMDTIFIKEKFDEIFKNYPEHLKFITTSRRTPKGIEELIEEYNFDYKLIYSKEPNINPIPDFLELCEELFISIDSTSMLSEAKANSEANVNIIELKSKKENTKFHRLVDVINSIDKKVDFEELLKDVEI